MKRWISALLFVIQLFACLNGITYAHAEEPQEIDLGVVTVNTNSSFQHLIPSYTEITEILPSGSMTISYGTEDNMPLNNNLDANVDIRELTVGAINAEESMEPQIIPENFVPDLALPENSAGDNDLDGGVEEEAVFLVDGCALVPESILTEHLAYEIPESDDLDGGMVTTKGYRLTVDEVTSKKGEAIHISWEMQDGAVSGQLYAILNSKAYKIFVSNKGSMELTLPYVGTWRICMTVYNENGKLVNNGYLDALGSLYLQVGDAPMWYDMSYCETEDKTYVFKVNAPNTDKYTAVILKQKESQDTQNYEEYQSMSFEGTNSGFSFKPTEAGLYKAYLILENMHGSYDGLKEGRVLSFMCKVPYGYSWKASADKVKPNETIYFQIDSWWEADSAQLIIKKDTAVVARSETFFRPCKLGYTPVENGNCTAYLILKNEYGFYNGLWMNGINFSVGNSPSSLGGMFFGSTYVTDFNTESDAPYYVVVERQGEDEDSYETVFCKKYNDSNEAMSFDIKQQGNFIIYFLTFLYGSYQQSEKQYIVCTTDREGKFLIHADNYGFCDTAEALGYKKNKYMNPKNYTYMFSNAHAVLKYKQANNGVWQGASFAMAATAGLIYQNHISLSSIDNTAKNLYEVQIPQNKESALSAMLEKYELAQQMPSVLLEKQKNKNDFEGLIAAVRAFENKEENAQPVVISVGNGKSRHALLGLSVTENINGQYMIGVYDSCAPDNDKLYIIVTPKAKAIEYINALGTYKEEITYVTTDIIYRAVNGDVSFEDDDTVSIYIDADKYTVCKLNGEQINPDVVGVPIVSDDGESYRNGYILPKDTYVIAFENFKERETHCAVSDENDAMVTVVKSRKGIMYAGVESYTQRIRCICEVPIIRSISTEWINALGEIQKFEIKGTYLGTAISSRGLMQINTDVFYVWQNGIFVDLTPSGPEWGDGDLDGLSTISLLGIDTKINAPDGMSTISLHDFDNNINDLDGFVSMEKEPYMLQITNQTIDRTQGVLTGKIGVVARNQTGEFASAIPVVAVYQNGKMIGLKKQAVIIAGNAGYFEVDVPKTEILSNDEIKIDVFMWDENMMPVANVVSLDI